MADTYIPKVNVAKELAEILKDFTNPRELIRETIANSLDASAALQRVRADLLRQRKVGIERTALRS